MGDPKMVSTVCTRTPLRLSLLGGSSDYPSFASKYGGLCVGLALDCYVYTMVKRRESFGEPKYRVATAQLDLVDAVKEITNPCVRGCLSVADPGSGVEVIHWADMPGRCGVGSSSSFAVGLLNALYALRGEFHTPGSLWRRACYVEQDVLHETVGYQDQAWAAFGGIGRLDFPAGNVEVRYTPLAIAPILTDQLCSHLLMVYTGTQRTASEVASRYVWDKATVDKTHQIKALAEEGWVALRNADWEKLGATLDIAWAAKRAVSPSISSSLIDILYSTARVCGAWGGKLMGAGGGAGCVAVLIPPEKRATCLEQMRLTCPALVEVPVKISNSGSRVIYAE